MGLVNEFFGALALGGPSAKSQQRKLQARMLKQQKQQQQRKDDIEKAEDFSNVVSANKDEMEQEQQKIQQREAQQENQDKQPEVSGGQKTSPKPKQESDKPQRYSDFKMVDKFLSKDEQWMIMPAVLAMGASMMGAPMVFAIVAGSLAATAFVAKKMYKNRDQIKAQSKIIKKNLTRDNIKKAFNKFSRNLGKNK